MNIFLYAIIFIIGILFGSFYTLAVYRIPKNIDIIKTHSYCPNCNHKLGFFELIPVLSYIFLGGKCKNCKQKIRLRYLILEIVSGIAFICLGIVLKINIDNITLFNIVIYIFSVLYLTAIILVAGIDNEWKKVDKRVLAYGIIISIVYMIYLYTINMIDIYKFVSYLMIYLILLLIDTFLLRRFAKESYLNNILIFLTVILIFTEIDVTILTIIVTIIEVILYIVLEKKRRKKEGNKKIKLNDVPIAFFIGFSNIIVFLVLAFTNSFII